MTKMKFARNLTILALAILLPTGAFAKKHPSDKANTRARALIARMKSHPEKKPTMAAAPLLNFSSSPKIPLQNKNLTWIVQFDNPFTNRLLSIEASIAGAPLKNIQSPSKGMFVIPLGLQTQAAAREISVTLFVENPANNADVRTAVAALDTDIRRLIPLINKERNPTNRALLMEQRDEKIALKSELLTQLKKYRYKIGTQAHSYVVQADPTSPTLPKIASISPITGVVGGGDAITITGSNFSPNVTAKFGGLSAASLTYVNNTTITAVTPNFNGSVGAKDLELNFTSGGNTFNALLPNAFFAVVAIPTIPSLQKPVAIATGSQKINLEQTVQLDGSMSYDSNGDSFTYSWSVVSAPPGSSFSEGQEISTEMNPSFTPDRHGTFTVQLIVTETSTPDLLASDPSIAVIQVGGPPDPVASAITVRRGESATTQVIANDPTPGEFFNYEIVENPQHGSVSISGSGLATFTSQGIFSGSDSFTVKVTNQSGLTGSVVIPVHIITDAPIQPLNPTAPAINVATDTAKSAWITVQDGDPFRFSFEVTQQPALGTVAVDAFGLVTYTAGSADGSDSVVIKVTQKDLPENFGSVSIPVIVVAGNQAAEIGDLEYQIVARGTPFKVALYATTNIVDSDGSLSEAEWDFGDGTVEKAYPGPTALIYHEYLATGTYTAQLTVKDNLGTATSKSFDVTVVNTDIPTAKFKGDSFVGTAPFTVNFDASDSSDSNGITEYWWNWNNSGEMAASEKVTTPTISHTFTESGVYPVQLMTKDANQAFGRSTVMVYVDEEPTQEAALPVADYSLTPSRERRIDQTFTFNGSRSFSPNIGQALSNYVWNFGDFYNCGSGCTATGVTATHNFQASNNYFVSLKAIAPGNLISDLAIQEVYVVHNGHAPRSVPQSDVVSGPAPLTVHFRSESYDYDGEIFRNDWNFADPDCVSNCTSSADAVAYTYQYPGIYFAELASTDDGDNKTNGYRLITVEDGKFSRQNAGRSRKVKPFDFGREEKRRMLTNSCARKDGESCFALSQMYAEDGKAFTAEKLKQRACTYGYEPACSK